MAVSPSSTTVNRSLPGLDAARPLLDALAQPVVVTGLDLVIMYWNPAAAARYGYSEPEALGKPVVALLGVQLDPAQVQHLVSQIRRGKSWAGKLESRGRSGELTVAIVTMTPLTIAGGVPTALIATVVDVTAAAADRRRLTAALATLEQKSDELRHQALHDSLTGLPNRALVLDRAEQMLSRARRVHTPVAALFLDLDNFKDINDSLGHAAGDELLQAVATRLSQALRASDTIGRLGGDEFVILLEGASLDAGSAVVAERVFDVLREPFVLGASGRTPHTVTASIGIAEGDRPEAEDLLRDADLALYRAKADGRNCYALFAAEMYAAAQRRLLMDVELRSALAQRQFFLEYQPVFNLGDGTTVGVEALLRWQHPTRGVVPPLAFVSELEATGLILPVGRWLLGEACRQCARWHRAGLPLTVSVNVSGRQLESNQFVDDVSAALATSGLAPSSLILEITESILMRDAEVTTVRLNRLSDTGVRIAIDDFGTGYSSLAYLQQFPVDILKIDRSFISATATEHHGEDEAILHTLVQLGKRLGLLTVAEGIETEDQLHRLQLQGCDAGQGFLVARPMGPAAIADFARSQQPGFAEPRHR